MDEEEEIAILMAREIVEDTCIVIDDDVERAKCRRILHRILLGARLDHQLALKELSELSESSRRKLRLRIEELFGLK
jgi:hypothetical protein